MICGDDTKVFTGSFSDLGINGIVASDFAIIFNVLDHLVEKLRSDILPK